MTIRMWREWTDDQGGHYTSETFEAWQNAMRPRRSELLAQWAAALRKLLDRNPGQVPHGQLHVLYEQAGTLRTLDAGTPWEDPFNRMRGAVQRGDFADLRALADELQKQ